MEATRGESDDHLRLRRVAHSFGERDLQLVVVAAGGSPRCPANTMDAMDDGTMVLCCQCAVPIPPNALNMCASCLQTRDAS